MTNRCTGASQKILIQALDAVFVSGHRRHINTVYIVSRNENASDMMRERLSKILESMDLLGGVTSYTEGLEVVALTSQSTKKVMIRFLSKEVFMRNYSSYCRGNRYVVFHDD